MNTQNISGSSKGKLWSIHDFFGYRSTEISDTSDVSRYSKREVWRTPNVSAYRRTESWHAHNVSDDRETAQLERQYEDNDARKMTAEGSRHTSDTSQQPSAYGDQTSILAEMFEIMKEMDNKITTLTDTVNTLLHLPDSCNRAFSGRGIQIQHQEKEENEVLKEMIKKLKARNQELLAKVMAMHPHSENINDPLRLSAVLERYEMLRLQQWEKVRSSTSYHWTYEQGSQFIKKLFDACEKYIQQRTDDILKGFDIPPSNDAMTKSKQEMMREIRKFFRQHYENYPKVYGKIVQDSPVKAEWEMNGRYLEHVDKKDAAHWENPSLLWPIMKRGEEMIVKGVVWDQSRMT